jgi:hypothetical protein
LKVVDVQMATPGKVFTETESGDSHGQVPLDGERSDESVAGGPLSLIHLSYEVVSVDQGRAERTHRIERLPRVRRQQLNDHATILTLDALLLEPANTCVTASAAGLPAS